MVNMEVFAVPCFPLFPRTRAYSPVPTGEARGISGVGPRNEDCLDGFRVFGITSCCVDETHLYHTEYVRPINIFH